MRKIRHADLPRHKETVMSELFGRFVGFVESKGLTKGKEYETRIKEMFEVSTKILWIDEYSDTLQMTVAVKSLDMSVEFGIVDKSTRKVLHRNKLESLRYNISPDTEMALTNGSQKKFDEFFDDFKYYFKKLEP